MSEKYGNNNVIIGTNILCEYNNCVLIGRNLTATHDGMVMVGTKEIAVSRNMTDEEVNYLLAVLPNVVQRKG